MRNVEDVDRLKRLLKIAGALAIVAVALTLVDRLLAAGTDKIVNDFSGAHAGGAQINAAIDAVLGRYPIEPKSVSSWKVMTPDKKFLRLEQRIVMPYDFAAVQCNHELSREILPFGGRIAATERSRENVVTMHVLNQGVIIRTISFAMRPYHPDKQVEKKKASAKRKVH